MFWVLKRTFEYPQLMFWLRNKKNNYQLHTLIWRPEYRLYRFETLMNLVATYDEYGGEYESHAAQLTNPNCNINPTAFLLV